MKLLIDRLERSLPALPIEQAAEPLLTLTQVSRRLKVSAKTVRRWKARHDLVGLEAYAREGVNQGYQSAREYRRQQADPGAARVVRDRGGGERAREHQAFERDVDDARTLREQPAERGQNQRRREPYSRVEKVDVE